MMCHRTGLSRYDYSWYYFPSASTGTLMKRVQNMEPSEPLRRKWQYNNFMFMLQGVVAAKFTDKSWQDNIREKLLQPLGMGNTNVSLVEWVKAADLAKGYSVLHDSAINKKDYYDISGMAAAGSINSSVSDMAKWVTALVSGKRDGKEKTGGEQDVRDFLVPGRRITIKQPLHRTLVLVGFKSADPVGNQRRFYFNITPNTINLRVGRPRKRS